MARAATTAALLAAAAAAAAGSDVGAAPAPTFARYIVVGAGPAGMQMAHYLDTAGRDYLVLDRASAPASFFAQYPRWRQLISVNKPNTGGSLADFVTRQDWNSLLAEHSTSSPAARSWNFSAVPCLRAALAGPTDGAGGGGKKAAADADAPPLVATGAPLCAAAGYSSTDAAYTIGGMATGGLRFAEVAGDVYYPSADLLTDFLRQWAAADTPRGAVAPVDPPSGRALRMAFNARVVNVTRPPGYAAALAAAGGSQAALLAAGVPRFRLTSDDGRAWECVTLVWASGMTQANRPEGVNVDSAALSYLSHPTDVEFYRNKSVLILGRGNGAFEIASHVLGVTSLVHIIGRDTGRIRLATETHYPGDVRHVHSRLLETYLLKSQDGLAELPQGSWELKRHPATGRWYIHDDSVACRTDAHGRPLDRCNVGRSYDVVISAPGWHFDPAPFAPEVRPAMAPNGKHPALGADYGAPGLPGLYIAGTIAHAADFRVSSGGFIHGFRYVVRALHRHLEEAEQAAATTAAVERGAAAAVAAAAAAVATAVPPPLSPPPAAWPRRRVGGLRSAVSALLRRMNNAAGPFQMFGSLADVLVLPPVDAAATANFTAGVGTLAPLVDPSSFYDPSVDDPALLQLPPAPLAPGDAEGAARRASDAVISAALAGGLFEEVPLRLAHLKAPGWSAQLAGGAAVDAYASSAGAPGAAEYITLTLEFGGKKTGRQPDGSYAYGLPDAGAALLGGSRAKGKKAAMMAKKPIMKPQEFDDPYALWRANASFWEPHKSRFLHPVLRYFHSGLAPRDLAPGAVPPPVLEHHILEDFNNDFSHHAAYVLSLARWLQDVGARRVRAARAMAAAPRAPAPVVNAIVGAPASAEAPLPLVVPPSEASRVLSEALTPPARPFKHPMAVFFRQHMQMTYATLFYRGHEIPGGASWFHALSMDAADELLYGGSTTGGPASAVTVVATHWLDWAPFPRTPAEAAAWDKLQADAKPYTDALGSATIAHVQAAVALTHAKPPMSPAQAAAQEEEDALLWRFYAAKTARTPGVPTLVMRARNGMGLEQAANFGVPSVPYHLIVDFKADRQKDVPHAVVVGEARKWQAAVAKAGGGGSSSRGSNGSGGGGGGGGGTAHADVPAVPPAPPAAGAAAAAVGSHR